MRDRDGKIVFAWKRFEGIGNILNIVNQLPYTYDYRVQHAMHSMTIAHIAAAQDYKIVSHRVGEGKKSADFHFTQLKSPVLSDILGSVDDHNLFNLCMTNVAENTVIDNKKRKDKPTLYSLVTEDNAYRLPTKYTNNINIFLPKTESELDRVLKSIVKIMAESVKGGIKIINANTVDSAYFLLFYAQPTFWIQTVRTFFHDAQMYALMIVSKIALSRLCMILKTKYKFEALLRTEGFWQIIKSIDQHMSEISDQESSIIDFRTMFGNILQYNSFLSSHDLTASRKMPSYMSTASQIQQLAMRRLPEDKIKLKQLLSRFLSSKNESILYEAENCISFIYSQKRYYEEFEQIDKLMKKYYNIFHNLNLKIAMRDMISDYGNTLQKYAEDMKICKFIISSIPEDNQDLLIRIA